MKNEDPAVLKLKHAYEGSLTLAAAHVLEPDRRERLRRLIAVPTGLLTMAHYGTWYDETIGGIIADADQVGPDTYGEKRRGCPLCGYKGSFGWHGYSGFSPSGLHEHLSSGHPPVPQCVVMQALAWLTEFENGEALDRDVRETQERQLVAKAHAEALRAERLLNETVYRIDPNEKPCLIDDYCEPRSPERMAWAIARLESLGFTVTDEGNVRTIVREWEGDLLYADPRYSHTIHFKRYSAGRYCHPGAQRITRLARQQSPRAI